MTKQQKWTPESPIEAWATTYESLAKALGGLQNKFEIPDAAREFVKHTAAAAKDGSTDLHAGANKVTGAIEEALVGAVNGMADVNRKVVEAACQDAEATFAAIDKLAGAQSLTEAYEVYVDYLRQQDNVANARAKSAASFVSAKGHRRNIPHVRPGWSCRANPSAILPNVPPVKDSGIGVLRCARAQTLHSRKSRSWKVAVATTNMSIARKVGQVVAESSDRGAMASQGLPPPLAFGSARPDGYTLALLNVVGGAPHPRGTAQAWHTDAAGARLVIHHQAVPELVAQLLAISQSGTTQDRHRNLP